MKKEKEMLTVKRAKWQVAIGASNLHFTNAPGCAEALSMPLSLDRKIQPKGARTALAAISNLYGTPPPLCVTFRWVVISLRGPGQSPVLPFACCVGLLLSVSRCGRCSCWCRFHVRRAQWLVCQGCAGYGMVCRLRVSGAQWLAY